MGRRESIYKKELTSLWDPQEEIFVHHRGCFGQFSDRIFLFLFPFIVLSKYIDLV